MKLDKFALALASFSLIFFLAISLTIYALKLENKQLKESIKSINENLFSLDNQIVHESAKRVHGYNKIDKVLINHKQKISVIEESIDPENSRWAKIKLVRAAVKKTIEDYRYDNYLGTIGITTYASAVVDYSEEYDVPISLILSVTRRESAFNPKIKSHAGAMGLMQLMPDTAKNIAGDLGVRHYNLFRIRDNVRFGVYYLMQMIDEFNGNYEHVLAAYNSGPTAVRKLLAGSFQDYFRETKEYVRVILGDKDTKGFVEYYQDMGFDGKEK